MRTTDRIGLAAWPSPTTAHLQPDASSSGGTQSRIDVVGKIREQGPRRRGQRPRVRSCKFGSFRCRVPLTPCRVSPRSCRRAGAARRPHAPLVARLILICLPALRCLCFCRDRHCRHTPAAASKQWRHALAPRRRSRITNGQRNAPLYDAGNRRSN